MADNANQNWTIRVDPARQLDMPREILRATAAACALVLGALAGFSLLEGSIAAGLTFSLKFTALLFCVTACVALGVNALMCKRRGIARLEYSLTPDGAALSENGRRAFFPAGEITGIGRARGGFVLRTKNKRMRVFCPAGARAETESLARKLYNL